MRKTKVWNQVSLLELSTQKRLARKSVFHLRGFNRLDYFPSCISDPSDYQDKYLLSPESSFITLWSILSIFLTTYQLFSIPFILSFDLEDYTELFILDTCITLFFIIDILLSFNLSIYKNGTLLKSRRIISKNYLKSFFLIDFISILPYFILPTPTRPSTFSSFKPYLNLLKLLRIIKLPKVTRLIQNQINTRCLSATFMLLEILVQDLVVAHVLACIFYSIGQYESSLQQKTWLSTAYFEYNSISELYVTSLYWSITTICTVGYGDIKPGSTSEVIFVIFSMIISCIMFGYVIGAVEAIVENSTNKSTKRRAIFVALNTLISKHALPKSLQVKLRLYLKYVLDSQTKTDSEENEVFSLLSNELKELVCVYTRGFVFSNFSAFSRFDPRFLRKIMLGMSIKCFSPNDLVFVEGEKSRDLYYITEGRVDLEDIKTACVVTQLGRSNFFGELAFFLGQPRCLTVYATGFLETFIIPWGYFSQCLDEDPESREYFDKLQGQNLQESYLELQVECYICKQVGHISKNCAFFDFGKTETLEKSKLNRTKRLKILKKQEGKIIPVRFLRYKQRNTDRPLFEKTELKQKNNLTVRKSVQERLVLESSDSAESRDSGKSIDVIRKNSFDVSLLSSNHRLI